MQATGLWAGSRSLGPRAPCRTPRGVPATRPGQLAAAARTAAAATERVHTHKRLPHCGRVPRGWKPRSAIL